MKKQHLKASLRSKDINVNTLRKESLVPAVIYGGSEHLIISVRENDIKKLVFTHNAYLIDLEVENKKIIQVLIKDIQFHPVTDVIIHIDFLQVLENKKVKTILPVDIFGNSIGVSKGGNLQVNFKKIRIEGFIKNFPDDIKIDIASLDIGEKIRIKDIVTSAFTINEPENAVVVDVRRSRSTTKSEEVEEVTTETTTEE